ncbi:MAG TPA: hypothetical protein PKD53_07105 [Chloroflexaceae bacterium]|nr:hypothetical protein [Chloroflexaceae bacterium]
MARQIPLTAQLVADLFLAIEQEDPAATFSAARALAARIGEPAAMALARGLIADRRVTAEALAAAGEPPRLVVSCA